MSNQQFATPSDALAHYGVKGMKWGVRKSESSGKVSSGQIKENRARLNSQGVELQKQARSSVNSPSEATAKVAAVRDLAAKMRNDPGFDSAYKLTKGEKWTSWLVGGPIGRLAASSQMKAQKEYALSILDEAADFSLDDIRKNY